MNFLFPAFLWGLLAISIPIAVHIFNFRRTKRVLFSNVTFLKSVETQTRSIRKIKHWLILAARIMAIACLVLAFAQPYLPGNNQTSDRKKGITSLYLDNSYSMQSESNNKRYIDIATGHLSDLLGLMPQTASLQLVTNDFSAQEQGLHRLDKVRDLLTTIGLSHTPRSFQDIYKRQENLISRHQSSGTHQQLFWFSDFQKSTSGNLANLKIDSTHQVYLVPIQGLPEKNIYVDSAWLNTPFIRELQNNILHVKVSNAGKEVAKNIVLKLNIDNAQVSTASVQVPANGSAIAKFNFNLKGKGYKKGQITFDDFPVTFDNNYYFVLNASPLIKVMHIYGGQNDHHDIDNVYANDSLFSLQSYSINNVDPGHVKNADLIVLDGTDKISGTLADELLLFVSKGGSLAIIPSATPDRTSFSPFLAQLGVNGLETNLKGPADPQTFAAPDRNNPYFNDVFEESVRQELNLNLPAASPVWSWSSAGQPLLSFRNGQPYLTRINRGLGQTYLFAAPLSPTYGSLAQHALFVPVMYKMAAMSVRPQRTAFTFDENPITLPLREVTPNTVFKLRRNKTEIIPIQRIVGNQLLLEIPQGDQLGDGLDAGYFDLLKDNQVEQIIALNHNHQESRLDGYTPQELKTIFAGQKNVQVFKGIEDGDFTDVFQRQSMGTSLWKYFLYAALFFLLVEILLIRFKK